jgi:DNA-binding MarR family transcriptional regulator
MPEQSFQIERMILKIGNQLNNLRDIDLKQKNLTTAQSETLLYFSEHEGAAIAELKGHLKISHQAARNLVARLKAKQYVSAQISPTDGRASAIYLTEQGHDICDLLKQSGSNVGMTLLHGFSDTEMNQFHHFLLRASDNMKKGNV